MSKKNLVWASYLVEVSSSGPSKLPIFSPLLRQFVAWNILQNFRSGVFGDLSWYFIENSRKIALVLAFCRVLTYPS